MRTTTYPLSRSIRREIITDLIGLFLLSPLPGIMVNTLTYYTKIWAIENLPAPQESLRVDEIDSLKGLVKYFYTGGLGEDLASKIYQGK